MGLNIHKWISSPRCFGGVSRPVLVCRDPNQSTPKTGLNMYSACKNALSTSRFASRKIEKSKKTSQHQSNMQVESLNLHVAVVHAPSPCVMCDMLSSSTRHDTKTCRRDDSHKDDTCSACHVITHQMSVLIRLTVRHVHNHVEKLSQPDSPLDIVFRTQISLKRTI